MSAYIHTSVTRIADLHESEFEVTEIDRQNWAIADYVVGRLTDDAREPRSPAAAGPGRLPRPAPRWSPGSPVARGRLQVLEEVPSLVRVDVGAQARVGQNPAQLIDLHQGGDEMKPTIQPGTDEPTWRTLRRDQPRDEDVRVKDDAHALRSLLRLRASSLPRQ